MKFFALSLLLPLSSWAAANDLVTCQVQDFKTCVACEKRIPVSCENHAFNGSLEIQTRPQSFEWIVSNPKAGTEKSVTTKNSKLSLKDLKGAKDIKALAAQLKLKTSADETLTLAAVQVPAKTVLYKAQTGKEVAGLMQAQNHQRNVASTQEPMAGGVRRAQQKNK